MYHDVETNELYLAGNSKENIRASNLGTDSMTNANRTDMELKDNPNDFTSHVSSNNKWEGKIRCRHKILTFCKLCIVQCV